MSEMPGLTVSVIIATKNRASELESTVESLLRQVRLPDEVIIVDQSPAKSVTEVLPSFIRYIHDPRISGANTARNAAMDLANCDILLFLDDDVELEPTFLQELLSAYSRDVAGVSGIITNYLRPSLGRRVWDTTFVLGVFHDPRQKVYWHADKLRNSPPILVDRLTGCLMSVRASVVGDRRWDSSLTGGSSQVQDDLDFCWSLPRESRLVIAPRARLTHHRTPTHRAMDHWIFSHTQTNYFMWNRYWCKGMWSRICFAWLNVGYAVAVLLSSLKRRSIVPWRKWREGARRGKEIARGLS